LGSGTIALSPATAFTGASGPTGGTTASAGTPATPVGMPAVAAGPSSITSPMSAAPPRLATSIASASASDASNGTGQTWGTPLNTGLYDNGDLHAGFNAYYSAGAAGSNQGGVIFSLTFRN
jgi:hypothetical protein